MVPSPEVLEVHDPDIGLDAYIVLDAPHREACAGGVRTRRYPSKAAALHDAKQLARAMSIKCALGGLPVGGAKAVVMNHDKLERRRAFERVGEIVESLQGRFRTAGDFGTTREDLDIMATKTQFVHINEAELSLSVARGLLACLNAGARFLKLPVDQGLLISVQGCGAIGSAVAKSLAATGHRVCVADTDSQKVQALDLPIVPVDEVLRAEVDVLSPCAIGGVISPSEVSRLRTTMICGAANNIVTDTSVHEALHHLGIVFVPDVISSAGAVIDGIGESVMGLKDRGPLIEHLGEVTHRVLVRSKAENCSPNFIALKLAEELTAL